MTISLRGTATKTAISNASQTWTLNFPAGVVSGDLVFAWCAWVESLLYKPEITKNLLEVNKKWLNPSKLMTDNEILEEEEGEKSKQKTVGARNY